MIERVVFDLGGVVFRWKPLELLPSLLPERMRSAGDAHHWMRQIFQGFEPGSDWAQFDLGLIDPVALARRIAQRIGLEEHEVARVIEGIPPHLTAVPGTVDLIERLHANGVPLFFLSNMPAPYAEHLTRSNRFFERFQDGIFSAHVGHIKPELPIFRAANERFGARGHDTVFIDDVLANIRTAEAHGWQGIHFVEPQQCGERLTELGVLR